MIVVATTVSANVAGGRAVVRELEAMAEVIVKTGAVDKIDINKTRANWRGISTVTIKVEGPASARFDEIVEELKSLLT